MKMTGVERLFVDTNVLIYATNEMSPWHGLANAALQEARQLLSSSSARVYGVRTAGDVWILSDVTEPQSESSSFCWNTDSIDTSIISPSELAAYGEMRSAHFTISLDDGYGNKLITLLHDVSIRIL